MGKLRGGWDKLDLIFKSNSLKTLDISGCGEEFVVAECSCPQLQSFVGSIYMSYQTPLRPRDSREFYDFFTANTRRKVKAGDWRFFGVDIPDSCLLEFKL